MSLYKLSGIEDNQDSIGDFWDRVRAPIKAVAKVVNQAADYAGDKARQASDFAKKEAQIIANQAQQALKTVGLAIPRNAFILLIRFNVHGWATGLKIKLLMI